MTRRILTLSLAVGLLGLPVGSRAQDRLEPAPDRPRWSFEMATGYDATLHSYALADQDTSETLAEFMVEAGVRGESVRGARHLWRVVAEASTGTQMWRERLDADYRYRDDRDVTRWRLLGRLWGRQFREDTEYVRSSDNWEGGLEGRASPWASNAAAFDLRAWGRFMDYRTPSSLEMDYRDAGLGVFARSRGTGLTQWSGGVARSARAYPDSAAIDRDTWSIEGDLDSHDLDGRGLRAYHKSARRLIQDETVRPSAWTHWTELRAAVGGHSDKIIIEIQSELWDYDEESDVYYGSWRFDSFLGYRWGDLLSALWQAGLNFERMDADDAPETYSQLGVRAGVDAYGTGLGGQLVLEYGRRTYDNGTTTVDDGIDASVDETIQLYTDFNYWKIWVMGNWAISRQLSLDLLASYEPENHTEKSDDTTLGYATLRLTWRP